MTDPYTLVSETLQAAGYRVVLDRTPHDAAAPPYILLLTSVPGAEQDNADLTGDWGPGVAEFMVRCVGRTSHEVRLMTSKTRAALNPDRHPAYIGHGPERHVVIGGQGSLGINSDSTVVVPTTGAPALFATDFYLLSPSPEE